MAWTRHKIRVDWHRRLKDDVTSREFGFTQRSFRSNELWSSYLSWWDYPPRTCSRSWKDQTKKRKQWER